MGQRVKDAPKEFPCEMQLFLRGDPEAGPARGETVILPASLIVVGEELNESREGVHKNEGLSTSNEKTNRLPAKLLMTDEA